MKDKLKKVKKPVKLLKTKKKKMVDAKKKKIESMSVNEFMNGFMDDGLKKGNKRFCRI